ncbi:hypothetical protein Pan258_18780 [Symmachiella dynata]|nr:hypothetical protein Pan258_18780 [Symmachiella dynata]
MSRRIIILTVSGSIVVAVLILGVVQGDVPYITIGLATIGTIWWRSALPSFPYPQVGGLFGTCIGTMYQLMVRPFDRLFGIFIWSENLALSIVVSIFVVTLFGPPAPSKDNKKASE